MKYGRVRKRQHVWMVFYLMHVGMHAHSSMANILISITISQRIWTGRTELEWAWKEMRRKKEVNAFRNAPWNQRRKQNSVLRTLISKLTGKSKKKNRSDDTPILTRCIAMCGFDSDDKRFHFNHFYLSYSYMCLCFLFLLFHYFRISGSHHQRHFALQLQ